MSYIYDLHLEERDQKRQTDKCIEIISVATAQTRAAGRQSVRGSVIICSQSRAGGGLLVIGDCQL